jgi:lipid II:glycine glycyltransferase (peptidoglycan interpeptide bridge formation enzyme)
VVSVGAWTAAVRANLGGGRGRVAHVRIDPEIESGGPLDRDGATVDTLRRLGWRAAPEVQPSVTRVVDLGAGEADLWSDLRKKWRQYVNRARTLGITVADVDADADPTAFPTFHRIMTETSRRTGTPIRTEAAYRDVWEAFRPGRGARLLEARDAAGEAQAVLLLVRAGSRVVEPYGGMTSAGAASRANYLLKWEAIRTSREAGASSYDMWGLVNPGIRQFKEGFGGREVALIGAWDLPLSRLGAAAYRLAEGRRRAARTQPAPIARGGTPEDE